MTAVDRGPKFPKKWVLWLSVRDPVGGLSMLDFFSRFFRLEPTDLKRLEERVTWVSSACRDVGTFKERASAVATELGPNSIRHLARIMGDWQVTPAELMDQFPGPTDWMVARCDAIFE